MPIFQKDDVSILFAHVPKAGGTSIEHLFRRQGWKVSFFDGGEEKPSINTVTWCSPQHFHADILLKLFNPKRFSYCFTIVREPIARIKSEVRWRKSYFNPNIVPEHWIDQALLGFERNPFIHDNHIRQQSDFIFDGMNVFRLEDGLDRVIAHLTDRFSGQLIPAAMPSVMESGTGAIELSDALLDRLMSFYSGDYRRFGYSIERG